MNCQEMANMHAVPAVEAMLTHRGNALITK